MQLLFYAGPLVAIHAWEAWRDDLDAVRHMPLIARYVTCVALAYLFVLFGEFGGVAVHLLPVLTLRHRTGDLFSVRQGRPCGTDY